MFLKRAIFLSALVGFMNVHLVYAAKTRLSGDEPVSQISKVEEYIYQEMRRSNGDPKKWVVVFDVDGTLTDTSTPIGIELVRERAQAVSFVNNLTDLGVKVVISSAWVNFHETLVRLEQIGLHENKSLTSNHEDARKNINSFYHESYTVPAFFMGEVSLKFGEMTHLFQVARLGQVSSVKSSERSDWAFRQKALAPYTIWSEQEMAEVTNLIFVDNSKKNIEYFKSDVEEFDLFPNAIADYFFLAEPEEEPEKDNAV